MRFAPLAALLSATIAVGCAPVASSAPALSDPREILIRTFASTAALRTVHVVIEGDVLGEALVGVALSGAVLEADVDLVQRHLSARLRSPDGRFDASAILVDGAAFTLDRGATAWTRSPMANPDQDPLAGLAATAAIAKALATAVRAPAVKTELVATETCAGAGCYHVRATLPADVVFAFGSNLAGRNNPDEKAPDGTPPVTIDAWVDTATLRLVQARVTNAANPQMSINVVLSRHDEAVSISAPANVVIRTDEPAPFPPSEVESPQP